MNEEMNDIVNIADSKGNEIPFEIIKVIRYEDKDYAIMHPMKKFEGLDEDSCVIFLMKESGDAVDLIPEQNDDILDTVYALYVEWATNVETEGCSGNCGGCKGCH